MNRILAVARREYVETAKTKTFLVTVFATPLVMAVIIVITSRIQSDIGSGARPTQKVAVVDLSEELLPVLETSFQDYNGSHPNRQIALERSWDGKEEVDSRAGFLKQEVRERRLDGFLFIPKGTIEGDASPSYYRRANEIDFTVLGTVQNLLNEAVTDKRCLRHNLSPELVAQVRKGVPLQQVDVTERAEEKVETMSPRMFVPFFFLFLMFFGVFGVNQQMLTGIIEEKSSRVIEVLLSTLTPFQFMAGKILGLTGIGLTVVGIWGAGCYGAATYQGLTGLVEVGEVLYFLVYFILGFALFSSIFAAIGSACNTIQEAQSMVMPISILLIAPLVGWVYFIQHPEGLWATALSFVPPLTPLVMMLRLAVRPDLPFLQVAGSIVVLALSVPVVMWASAKIFRTGVLMYGKPPSLREILRWVRAR